ncbi:cupredoxin domain-containing protein, partial [Streptococcus hyovaginalis]
MGKKGVKNGGKEVGGRGEGGEKADSLELVGGVTDNSFFDPQTDSGLVGQVWFPDFDRKADLPVHEDFAIELTPREKGEFGFSGGMDMY